MDAVYLIVSSIARAWGITGSDSGRTVVRTGLPVTKSASLFNTSDRLRAIELDSVAATWPPACMNHPLGRTWTATLRVPGQREIEVVIDEDGYTELRYWASLSATRPMP